MTTPKGRAVLRCNRPDHDVPSLTCGYPIPCPWHTVLIDTEKPASMTVPARNMRPIIVSRLQGLAKELEGKE